MSRKSLEYDRLVEKALRAVVRDALRQVAEDGLPGDHHFYITFVTTHPGVTLAERLRERYPDEMTIVIQHQFSNLLVSDEGFGVTLSFSGIADHLEIPFSAVTAFADPSVQFGLQFRRTEEEEEDDGSEKSRLKPVEQAAGPQAKPSRKRDAGPSRIPQSGGGKTEKSREEPEQAPCPASEPETPEEKVVTLDSFRKK
jgi:hypothetical protein